MIEFWRFSMRAYTHTNEQMRIVHIDVYIDDFLNTPVPRSHNFNLECGVNSYNVRVTSPGDWDLSSTTVQARQQTWTIRADCNLGGVPDISAHITIDKTFEAGAATGTAQLTGTVTADGSRNCEFDFRVDFDTVTGEAEVTDGDFCGRPAVSLESDWTVPGYEDEYLVGNY
jgi:hypothetical protein